MNCQERPVSFSSGGVPLHGLYYEPAAHSEPQGVAVICDPFAEEKKCAQRVLAEAGRVLSGIGIAALHFDYRGTGDSAGRFVDFGPTQWREDIQTAMEFARSYSDVPRVGLLGLRLGASLAAHIAEQNAGVAWLVMWEPIIAGQQFVRENLRRSLIKAMLTQGEEFSAQQVTDAHQAALIDLDGYQISTKTQAELSPIDLTAPKNFGGPVLVINVSARPQVSKEFSVLAETYARAEARAVVLEPFWNRIGVIDAEPLLRITQQWLQQIVKPE